MAYQKLMDYHFDLADYLKPPSPPGLLLTKLFVFGAASGLANGFVGYGIYSAFSDNLLIFMGFVFSLLGLFMQHTLYNNVAKIARKNMRRGEDNQLSINSTENVIIRSINVFCAIMTIFTAMQVAGNKIEWKQQQAQTIAAEINDISTEKDSTLARFDRNIKRYQELDKITYYAIPEQMRRQAYLDSINQVINQKSTQYASLRTNLVNTKDYTGVFKFLSGGIQWLSIIFTLIAGSLFYVVIDSGYVSDAETYSQYSCAKNLEEKENKLNNNGASDTVRPAAPNDPPENNFETDREKKLRNIMQRIRDGNPKDNTVVIAKYLNNSRKTYDEISEALKHDLGVSKSTSWIGDVQEALKRMGENVRK